MKKSYQIILDNVIHTALNDDRTPEDIVGGSPKTRDEIIQELDERAEKFRKEMVGNPPTFISLTSPQIMTRELMVIQMLKAIKRLRGDFGE